MPFSKFSLDLRLTAVWIFVGLCACQQPSAPSPPVPMEKMEKILLDLQLAETYSLGLGDSVKSRFVKNKDSLATYYQSIFNHHNITADSFILAMNWYQNHPALTDSLFNRTLDRLNKENARLNIQSENDEAQDKANALGDTLHKDTSTVPPSQRLGDSGMQLLEPIMKSDSSSKTEAS